MIFKSVLKFLEGEDVRLSWKTVCLAHNKPGIQSLAPQKSVMVAHTCNSTVLEAEADQFQLLHRQFKASLC